MSFILAHPEKEKSVILLSYKKGFASAFRYSTGQTVEVSKWDKINQRAIKNNAVNFELERYEKFLTKIISSAQAQEIPVTKEYLFEPDDIILILYGLLQHLYLIQKRLHMPVRWFLGIILCS